MPMGPKPAEVGGEAPNECLLAGTGSNKSSRCARDLAHSSEKGHWLRHRRPHLPSPAATKGAQQAGRTSEI